MQMVSPSRITHLAKEHHVDRSVPVIRFASSCYDKGMVEVLKEVARKELYHNYEPIEPPESIKKAESQAHEQYHLLNESLTQEQKELLKACDEAYQTLNALETGEEFIHGFIRGYRYIKRNAADGVR